MINKDRIESITVTVVEDDQDPEQLLLDLGTELCEQLGWQVGDTLTWKDNQDGSWTLTKTQT
jgi:hypothetical protein